MQYKAIAVSVEKLSNWAYIKYFLHKNYNYFKIKTGLSECYRILQSDWSECVINNVWLISYNGMVLTNY